MQMSDVDFDCIRIERVDPEVNMYRFYRLRLLPDLFGGVSLQREWGRIGSQGQSRVDLFADAKEAMDALRKVYGSKKSRGYHRIN